MTSDVGNGLHEECVHEIDQKDHDNRSNIDPAKRLRGDELSKRLQDRLSQIVEDDSKSIKGRHLNPREDRPKNDNPHIKHQDEMYDAGHGVQKISEKNHSCLILSVNSFDDINPEYPCTWQ